MNTWYTPVLRPPVEESSDWYKEFHNIYYLSQLTNLTLLSYLETLLHYDKDDTSIAFEKELEDKKIIIKDDCTNSYIVNKEAEFNSYHLMDTLLQLKEKVFAVNEIKTDAYLRAMGIDRVGYEYKNSAFNLNEILAKTTASNWYDAIKGMLNIWEFMFLYSTVETTLKKVFQKEGKVREEDLIKDIFNRYPSVRQEVGDISSLWTLYTELRNIYAHSHGLINNKVKSSIGGKLENTKSYLRKIKYNLVLMDDIEILFKKDFMVVGKVNLLKDRELNLFRNLVINVMESLDKVTQSDDAS